MRRLFDTPGRIRAVMLAVALCAFVLVAVSGCKSLNTPGTTTQGAVDSTGTVQAEIPTQPVTVPATATPGLEVTTSAPAEPAAKPAPPTLWPAKVGTYAKGVKVPVWFPKAVPHGYKIDTIDVVELDKGTGLICDIVFLNGDKALLFTQGSPKERSYDIVSVEKVPWGTDTADVVHQDPADTSSPTMIVYNKGGNFAELQGDLTLDQLKAVAASMVRVK